MIVDETIPVYVPNVFSPNNRDGVNDWFTIYGDPAQIERVEMFQIYDRWGSLLFTKTQFPINDPQQGWDGTAGGKKLNRGVFVYWAEVLLRNGERVIVEGDVLIVE
jgi:gliding motility-associated-like protein